jgi:hypothetical protein
VGHMKSAQNVSLLALLLIPIAVLGGCSNYPNWTPEERLNAQLVMHAWRAAADAARLQYDMGRLRSATSEDVDLLAEKLRGAIAIAEQVDESMLEKMHRGLRARWKGQFIEGMKQRLKNLTSPHGDSEAEWLGSAMLARFGDWIAENSGRIRMPKLEAPAKDQPSAGDATRP